MVERAQEGQALAVPAKPASGLDASRCDPSRIAMFVEILSAMGGTSDASDSPHSWLNAFCEDHEGHHPDTFNASIEQGLCGYSHNSDWDTGTVYLTDKGRVFAIAIEAATAGETGTGSTEGEGAGPKDIAQGEAA